ncbi:hypothetical protein H8E77_00545 [bacterium]|nr:hypothetical protein [bacterium]
MYFKISFILLLFGLISCQSTLKEQLLEPPPEVINFALATRGATAESPDNEPPHLPEEVIDGDTSSDTWDEGSGWAGNLNHLKSDEIRKRSYVQINLPEEKQIKRIVVYTIDSQKYPAKKYGLKSYRLEYWHGTGWGLIPTGRQVDVQYTVRENTAGKIVHDINGRLITDKVRLVPIYSNDTKKSYELTAFGGRAVYNIEGFARVMEIQVWGYDLPTGKTAPKFTKLLVPQGKPELSDEMLIREVLQIYESGYESEDLEKVMSCFSQNYFSNGRGYGDIRNKAIDFFQQNDNIVLTISNLNMYTNVIDGTIIANAILTLQYIPVGNKQPKQVSWKFALTFAREDDKWKIISAD